MDAAIAAANVPDWVRHNLEPDALAARSFTTWRPERHRRLLLALEAEGDAVRRFHLREGEENPRMHVTTFPSEMELVRLHALTDRVLLDAAAVTEKSFTNPGTQDLAWAGMVRLCKRCLPPLWSDAVARRISYPPDVMERTDDERLKLIFAAACVTGGGAQCTQMEHSLFVRAVYGILGPGPGMTEPEPKNRKRVMQTAASVQVRARRPRTCNTAPRETGSGGEAAEEGDQTPSEMPGHEDASQDDP